MSRLLIIISLFYSTQLMARVQCSKGVQFPSYVDVVMDSQQKVRLDLNGVGLRKFFVFNAFYAGLYLQSPSQNGVEILNSDEIKVGIIHALVNIDKKQLTKMWNDEYTRLCGSPQSCNQMRPYHNKLLSYARDVKAGERLYLVAFADRFEFEINNKEFFDPVYSPEYSRLLQNSMFGPDAANAELKKGLLGQKKICKEV